MTGNVTDLKFLGESVGGLELHDMLHKLLHCQRLVTIWNTRLNINYILVPQPNSYNKTTRGSFEHVTCGQQQGCRWSRYNFRRCVIWVEISCLETVSVTYTQTQNLK